MRAILPVVVAILLLAVPARADRRELYVVLEGTPILLQTDDAVNGVSRGTRFGEGAQVAAYYGLTNTLHVGGAVRGAHASGFTFGDKSVHLPDGTDALGSFNQDVWGLGLSALGLYRLDTGLNIAPVFRLELGGTYVRHTGLTFQTAGLPLQYQFEPVTELVFGARVVAAVEYRFANRFVTSIGLGFRQNFNALAVRQFEVPISFGYVW